MVVVQMTLQRSIIDNRCPSSASLFSWWWRVGDDDRLSRVRNLLHLLYATCNSGVRVSAPPPLSLDSGESTIPKAIPKDM